MKINPYEELANAIILRAAKDYKKILSSVKINPRNSSLKYQKSQIEKFFRSRWFKELTDADGEFIITQLKEEYLYDHKGIFVSGKVY